MRALLETLREYAPCSTVQVPIEGPVNDILQHGELFVGNPIKYRLMTPKACHQNVLALYKQQKIVNMCSGYALAPDRKWRYHSWGLTKAMDIVETTAPFLLYFGCILVEENSADVA